MPVDHAALTSLLIKLDQSLKDDYTLVAAGGTALTLRGIKETTKDVDFIVERGDIGRLRTVCDTMPDIRLDLFGPGMVFRNKLPADYLAHIVNTKSLRNSKPSVERLPTAHLARDGWVWGFRKLSAFTIPAGMVVLQG